MKHRILTVGRPVPWARAVAEEFTKRIRGFSGMEVVHVKEGIRQEKDLQEKSEGWERVVLDERGTAFSTAGWKKEFDRWERAGRGKTAWILGGADGHSENLRKSCDRLVSLGPQTLSHDLALVVLLEQIYRVESWRAGHPYHRE